MELAPGPRRCDHGAMRTSLRRALLAAAFLLACGGEERHAETANVVNPNCGTRLNDWCPAPPDDPCGAHKDKASCQSDPRCVGMRYKGESLIACHFDERGFADNCPTVGCMSAPKKN